MKRIESKPIWWTLVFTLLLAISAATGCGKKIEVDTVNLEYSFQTADETNMNTVTEAIEAIEKAEYNTALEKLKTVSADTNLTAEQKTAVNDVIAKLQTP